MSINLNHSALSYWNNLESWFDVVSPPPDLAVNPSLASSLDRWLLQAEMGEVSQIQLNPSFTKELEELVLGIKKPSDLSVEELVNLLPLLEELKLIKLFHVCIDNVWLKVETQVVDLDKLQEAFSQGNPSAQIVRGYYFQHLDSKEKAFECYRSLAAKDHPWALYLLGITYMNDSSFMPKDVKKALTLLERSSELGCHGANYYLGNLYLNGIEVKPNPQLAFQYLSLSKNVGYAKVEVQLAQYYLGTKDFENALKNIQLAVDLGSAHAQHLLGNWYLTGTEYVVKDLKLAFNLLQQAAEQKYNAGQNSLGYCYGTGSGTQQNPELAFKLYKLAAEQKEESGMRNLGYCYLNGFGTSENIKEAFIWLKASAEKGFILSYELLAECYLNEETPFSVLDAIDWLEKGIKKGDENCRASLKKLKATKGFDAFVQAERCLFGRGASRNPNKAYAYYEYSSSQGYSKANERHSYISLAKKTGVSQAAIEVLVLSKFKGYSHSDNVQEAFEGIRNAANLGDSVAQRYLGEFYLTGTYVKQDKKIAREWLEKAEARSHL